MTQSGSEQRELLAKQSRVCHLHRWPHNLDGKTNLTIASGGEKKKPGEIRRSGHHRGWGEFRDADGWVDGGVALEVTSPSRWDGPPVSGGTGWD